LTKPAILALADGTIFTGSAIGAEGHCCGELVFNTAMIGYQEILTDPSYYQQIVTLTYPHIGNTGINHEDQEAATTYAGGLVIRDLPLLASNWRQQASLQDYLTSQQVVAIADIDTRRLTRILRQQGAQNGCILAGQAISSAVEEHAIHLAREFPGLAGADLAKEVTCKQSYQWQQGGNWSPSDGYKQPQQSGQYHVVAYDFGVKRNILRLLVSLGCRVTLVPAQTTAQQVLALAPEGVFLSNGPGDPQPCDYAIQAIQELLATNIPIFGICLGHQLLALACGAQTFKMKFGHHGANHPIQELASGQVIISSQNHSFAVSADNLPDCLTVTHKSLFDGTIQGIRHRHKPAFSIQGHPEASPGPQDLQPLFKHFINLMANHKTMTYA
jgi:carbamoyl-phosphate synthase small subunit